MRFQDGKSGPNFNVLKVIFIKRKRATQQQLFKLIPKHTCNAERIALKMYYFFMIC